MSFGLLTAALLLGSYCSGFCAAQSQAEYTAMTFDFSRPGMAVPHWKIEVHPDGSGTYAGAAVSGAAGQSIHVSAAVQEKLGVAYPAVRSGKCETKQKNIANTGRKTFTYTGADGIPASCTFNYSDNDSLNAAANVFLSLAETMQAGDRLAQKHRFDRLGLDAELDGLLEQVKSGRATEINNIAPVLQSIADDERLMERVQRKAARLLQDAGVTPASANSAR